MRKIIVSMFVSLDGVIENPMWTFPYWNDKIRQFKIEEDNVTDALLLGRVTYEAFAQAWPDSPDEGAPRINSMPKYVVSNTLQTTTWNNSHIVRGDLATEIKKLKQQEGQNLLIYGSGALVNSLMKFDLIDEYRFQLYPVVLGSGQRFFNEGSKATLNLVENRDLGMGVMGLVYHPVRK